jgi:hypothetical protein
MSNCASYIQFQKSKTHCDNEVSIFLKFAVFIWGIYNFLKPLFDIVFCLLNVQ